MTVSLQHIGASIYAPMAQEIDAALAANPKLDLLGMFYLDDVDVDSICIRKTI